MDRLLRRRGLMIGAGIGAILLLGLGVVFLSASPAPVGAEPPTPTPSATPTATVSSTPMPTPDPTPTPVMLTGTCPLSGLPADEALLDRPTLLVQIENHPDGRPPSNLARADLIIEAPVEGDTTRFSALFLCQATDSLTGPVRSARYYNVDLWQQVRALTVGFGAAHNVLQRFSAAGMPYLNGISGQWPYFERIPSRVAPHNLYLDLEALRADLAVGRGPAGLASWAGTLRPPFSFDDSPVLPAGREVRELTINTTATWQFGWRWSRSADRWVRLEAGMPLFDAAQEERLLARTVIIQVVTQQILWGDNDPGGNPRRLQHLIGTGSGTAYIDGRAYELIWSRPTADDHTSWTLVESGEPLLLPPGTVWWEIVPTTAAIGEE